MNDKYINAPFRGVEIHMKDYKGIRLHEGDIIAHPNEHTKGVIKYVLHRCQFRILYKPDPIQVSLDVGLNVGKKGQATKVGSVYNDADFEVYKKHVDF